MTTDKELAIEMVRCLPDGATWDDVIYGLYVLSCGKKGLKPLPQSEIDIEEYMYTLYVKDKIKKGIGSADRSDLTPIEEGRKKFE